MCSRHLVLDMLRIRVQGWDKPFAQCRTADKTCRRKHSQSEELIHVRKDRVNHNSAKGQERSNFLSIVLNQGNGLSIWLSLSPWTDFLYLLACQSS